MMHSINPSLLGKQVQRAWIIILALWCTSAATAQEKQKWTPHHVAKLRTVTSAAISPNGKQVAYLLSVPRNLASEQDGPAWTELHVVDVEKNSRPFVVGQTNVSNIAWAPDGSAISFLDKRAGDKNRSIYIIPLAGGEARKVFEHSTDIQDYSWSPDGRQVAFLAKEPEPEDKKRLSDKGFNQEIYEEDLRPVKVWIATIDGRSKARVLPLEGSASELHWSPAGDKLAVALAPTPLVDDGYMFRKVRVVDPKSGEVVQKLDNPGKMGQLAWSRDGKMLALIAGVDKHDPKEGHLWVADVADGKWHDLTPNIEGHVSSVAWTDANTIAYVTDKGVYTSVDKVKLGSKDSPMGRPKADAGNLQAPTGGPILANLSISADGKTMAFVGHTPRHPGEVFILGVNEQEPRRLTNSNPWLKDMAFAKQEVIRHKARDGLELEGILVHPLNEEKGKRYPLVLTVHGGPEAHVPNGWVTSYANLGQVGAANGMAVFYPNYRGSTGRGVEFSMMGQRDAAGKEFDDLVDAVDHLVNMGLVDKKKVGITGGSYGGYATAWGSTYYSDRFAAGVMFVGISDNVSKVGTTDIPWEMYLVHHRKWLWEDWEYFLKRSPIYYVEKARTPLLILHGKVDPRVHPGQSMELYRHLKLLGKTPVRLIFYPGEGHGNRRAASRLDYNLRLLQWMEHFLKGPGGSPPPTNIDYGTELTKEKKNDKK